MTDQNNKGPDRQQPISEELFLRYINNQVSPEEGLEIEKQIAESSLLSDAEEGLQLFPEKKELNSFVLSINQRMKKNLKKRRWKYRRNTPKLFPLLLLTIILLLLITISFWVIYRMKGG